MSTSRMKASSRYDVEKFARAPIARLVLDVFLEAEIGRLVRITGAHHVPSGVTAAQGSYRPHRDRICRDFWLFVAESGTGEEPCSFGTITRASTRQLYTVGNPGLYLILMSRLYLAWSLAPNGRNSGDETTTCGPPSTRGGSAAHRG
jgi:hypothetical protein